MTNSDLYSQIYEVCSFALIPYLCIVLFTIPYFVYQKFLILCRIKNIPASTIFSADLSKVKKNLQLSSLIHTFILILYSFEAIICLSNTSTTIYNVFNPDIITYSVVVVTDANSNDSCTLEKTTNIGIFLSISDNLIFLLPIPLNLFIIILRRAYLNVPYKRWIMAYSGYFLFRLVYFISSNCFIFTGYFIYSMQLPFIFFDIYIYVNASKKFYLLLKGIGEEAKWNSTPRMYQNKRRTALYFYITRVIVLFASVIFITTVLLNSITEFATMIKNSHCMLRYLVPNTQINFTVPNSLTQILNRTSYYSQIVNLICSLFICAMVFLLNLEILIWIVKKLIIRRKVYIHVNDWITRPLMERYRADVGRNPDRRPPFIQAFRSHFIY